MTAEVRWPRNDYSRVPFRLHHDEELYALEMERIFRGPAWSYLCSKPRSRTRATSAPPGSATRRSSCRAPRTARSTRSSTAARTAARMIVRELRGNAWRHVCLYHRWCYSVEGDLMGVPFRRGLKGEGGMPDDFDPEGARPESSPWRTTRACVFGTFAAELEPLETTSASSAPA